MRFQNICPTLFFIPFAHFSRFVPREKMTQKCDPIVREECSMKMRTECDNVCKEQCEDKDKRVCMTVPNQECSEVPFENCVDVPKTDCRKVNYQFTQIKSQFFLINIFFQVPRERCFNYERDPKPKVCRTKTRIECRTEPKEKCKNVVATECRPMPRRKCRRPKAKQEKCSQNCQPVFWCKVCQS